MAPKQMRTTQLEDYASRASRTHLSIAQNGLFFQLVMLAQLGRYRIGHDLTTMDFGGLPPINSGMPAGLRVAMNGHSKIASADALLHYIFELERGLLLIHACLRNFFLC